MPISLVIPTYNRPQFLRRLLWYYRELRFPFTIVVADSSPTPASDVNRELVASLQNVLTVQYRLYPSDIHICTKIPQALDGIDTKYAAICGDDDYIIPKTMKQCVCFLDANPDYSLAHGHAAAFSVLSDHHSHHNLQTVTYPQCNIEVSDPQQRLHNHLLEWDATWYSVHRRLDLIRNMQSACGHTIDNRFAELLPSCLSLIQGKARRLDNLYLVRQSLPNSMGRQMDKEALWSDLMTFDDFSQRYVAFRNCLATELSNTSGIPLAEAQEVTNYAFWGFLKTQMDELPLLRLSSSEQTILRAWQILQLLPSAFRSALLERQLVAMMRSPRESFRKLRRERAAETKSKRDDISLGRLLDPQSPFHADFLPIYQNVMRYPYGVVA